MMGGQLPSSKCCDTTGRNGAKYPHGKRLCLLTCLLMGDPGTAAVLRFREKKEKKKRTDYRLLSAVL